MSIDFKPGDKVRVIDGVRSGGRVETGQEHTVDRVDWGHDIGPVIYLEGKRGPFFARRFELVQRGAAVDSDRVFVPRERVIVVNAEGTPWRPGQEVSVEEVSGGWVKIIGHGSHWLAGRFRKVVPEPRQITVRMAESTRVVVVPNDIDVNAFPRRSYDFNKGDRRFTDPERAVQHALEEQARTGKQQVVRRDPGSYDFQELFLVQALGS